MDINHLYQLFLRSKGISTDTRKDIRGTLFFALKGENFNGNRFVKQAFEAGAEYVVADELTDDSLKITHGNRLLIVDDSLKTLQQLAAEHRRHFKCPVLAITGSNGKTTTKELAAAVLSQKFKTYFTQGNLNNHIGIPQTLLAVKEDAEFIIIEMGANHQGEIASYCEYVQPDYGMITNVGMAHVEGFGGFEGVVKGKTELYRHIGERGGKLFVPADNPILIHKSNGLAERITYGQSPDAYCRGKLNSSKSELLALSFYEEDKEIPVQTQLVGHYNFENVLSAICLGQYFGVETSAICRAVESYTPTNNRSQKILYGTNTIILDAYNANPSSMAEALKNFDQIAADNKMVILGQMLELGEYADAEHRRIADEAINMKLNYRVFVGDGFSFLKGHSSALYFETGADVKAWLEQQRPEHYHILIKGSRKNELEKILNR